MDERKKRPWWKLHALTWLVAAVVALTIFARNLETAYATVSYSDEDQDRQFHGWPRIWAAHARRPYGYAVDYFNFELLRTPQRLSVINWSALAIDGLVWLAMLCGSIWTIEKWCRIGAVRFHLTLRFLLALTAVVGCMMAAYSGPEKQQFGFSEWEWVLIDLLKHLPRDLTYLIVLLTWLALFDLVGMIWHSLVERNAK